MQDVLHEDVYVDENPVALKVLDNVFFVLGAFALSRFIRGVSQLMLDGRPVGHWSQIWDRLSGITFALWSLWDELGGEREQWSKMIWFDGLRA